MKKLLPIKSDALWLCMCAFFMSAQYGVYAVAFPFIMRSVGGTDKDLGLCLGLNFTFYIIGCLISVPLIDHFSAKRVSQLSLSSLAIGYVLIILVVVFHGKGNLPFNPVIAVTVIMMTSGLFIAPFWPAITGWISVGHEGASLNRRMAIFNVCWSGALLLSQYLGGFLAEFEHPVALEAVLILMFICIVSISFAKKPQSHVQFARTSKQIVTEFDPMLPKFRLMAKFALVIAFVGIGLARSQVALLFAEEFGYSKSQYGIAMTVMCAIIMLTFFIVSKTHWWHYKLWLFLFIQAAAAISMLIIITCSSLPALFLAAGLIGLTQSFIYSSHMFYAISGKVKRSATVAIHEVLLSIGFIIGSTGGGYMAGFLGRRTAPYIFGLCVICAGIAIQLIIWFFLPVKKSVPQITD